MSGRPARLTLYLVLAVLLLAVVFWQYTLALLLYGPAYFASAFGPPSNSFPNSISEVDGKGSLRWWGCLALPSGDVREVSHDGRVLFFMPGGKCERDPSLPDTTEHLFVTWGEAGARTGEPVAAHLIVAGSCPNEIPEMARREAAALIQEFIEYPRVSDEYRANGKRLHEAILDLSGPTSRLDPNSSAAAFNQATFFGGIWGPRRRPGTYPVCVATTQSLPFIATPP